MSEAVWRIGQKFVDSPVGLFLVFGIALFVLGVAGGVKYNGWLVLPPLGSALTSAFGVALVIFSAFNINRKPVNIPRAIDHEVKITHPRRDEKVSIINIEGTISKPLPDKYSLEIFRIYIGVETFTHIGRAIVSDNSWRADACDIGGISGDRRAIGAYMVGPIGRYVLQHFRECSRTHQKTLNDYYASTNAKGEYLPNFRLQSFLETIPDVVECQRIYVERE